MGEISRAGGEGMLEKRAVQRSKGLAYVFVRRDGAWLPTGPAGHLGWGFATQDGAGFYCGATENPFTAPLILPGHENGWWSLAASSEQAICDAMRSRGYDGYKVATVRDCDPKKARDIADATRTAGYTIFTNNCMDHVYAVLEAYGIKGLPWKQNHPAPNEWFVYFIGEYRNL